MGYLFTATVLTPKQDKTTNNKYLMKNLSRIALFAFAAASFTFASCESKTAENVEDATEETIDAAGDELDEATTPSAGDTAIVQDQPVQDGVVDSTGTK